MRGEYHSLDSLPLELIYKLMYYLDSKDYLTVSKINRYYQDQNLWRFNIQPKINKKWLGHFDDVNSHWFKQYLQEIDFKQYIADIYYCIFNENIDPIPKYNYQKIIYSRKKFDTRNFRNIINTNSFGQDIYIPKHNKVRIHQVYRIDCLSYNKLKRNHYHILALIY